MNKRQILYLLLFLVLSACSRKTRDDAPITYWSSNNSGEIDFASDRVTEWNKANPDQQVFFQPVPEGQSSEEIVLAAVVGKTTPDIYANMWQGSVEFYAKSNTLFALDSIEGFIEFINQRCDSATVKEITSSDGHIYQIPWKINPIMTLYNKGIFDELGLDAVPQTYSEFLSAAEKFKQDTDGDGYIDQWIGNTSVKVIWYQRLFNFYPLYLAASNGMPLIKNNRAFFNNKFAIETFAFLQELYKQNYFTKARLSAGQDVFLDKKIATKFTGPWEINYLAKFKSNDLEFDFFPVPVPDNHTGAIYTYGDPKSIVIFKTSKNPALAFEFIKTLIDEQGDLIFLEKTNQLPRRKGLDSLPAFQNYFSQNPKLEVFAQQAKYIKGVDNSELIVEILDIISQEYEACVIYNIKTPEKAIADAEKAVNILLRAK